MALNLRHIFSDSGTLRPLAYQILSSGAVSRNPVYRHFYSRRIRGAQEKGLAFPCTVAIEGTNACNSACIMCGHRNMRRPKGVMSMDLFKEILEQIKNWPLKSLLLSGFGEPLLDPFLEERISLAKDSGLKNIGLVTNAFLLNPEKAAKLSAVGLDFMHISLDGATMETYQQLRPGLDYRTVVSNLNNLLAMPSRPRVFIQVVTLEGNMAEADALRKLWHSRADRLIFRQAQDWAGQVSLPGRSKSPHLSDRRQWPPCRYLWEQINIYWDGTVPACCLDYEARQLMGDAGRQALKDIWQGPEFSDIRQKHNAGQRDQILLCRHCRYYSVWW